MCDLIFEKKIYLTQNDCFDFLEKVIEHKMCVSIFEKSYWT